MSLRSHLGMLNVALIREVSPSISRCELTHLARVSIDYELARKQHSAYASALASCGCRVVRLPAEPDLPDSVFVEDVALVLDEVAVITRPGVASRRPESVTVIEALRQYRELRFIRDPGSLEGGDILRLGNRLWVGTSSRSNAEGIRQLQLLVADFGYRVEAVPVQACLHLKSAVTAVAPGLLLANPAWVETGRFAGFEVLAVDEGEAFGANALVVGAKVIYPDSFPRTRRRLEARGLEVTGVDVGELQKAEGAVTCCSLVFRAADM